MRREDSASSLSLDRPGPILQVVGRRHAVVHLLLQLRRPHGDQRRLDGAQDGVPLQQRAVRPDRLGVHVRLRAERALGRTSGGQVSAQGRSSSADYSCGAPSRERPAFCRRLWEFIFVRATEGLGETFYFPATMSLISDYHTKRTRSLAMGLHQTSVYAGTIGGTTLAGLLAENVRVAVALHGLRNRRRHAGRRPGDFSARAGPQRGGAARAGRDRRRARAAHHSPLAIPQRADSTPSALLLVAAFFGANSVGLVFITWMPELPERAFPHVVGDGRLQRDVLSAGRQRHRLDPGRGAWPTGPASTSPAAGS